MGSNKNSTVLPQLWCLSTEPTSHFSASQLKLHLFSLRYYSQFLTVQICLSFEVPSIYFSQRDPLAWNWSWNSEVKQFPPSNHIRTTLNSHLPCPPEVSQQMHLPSVQSYHTSSMNIKSSANYYYIIYFLTRAFLNFPPQFLVIC